MSFGVLGHEEWGEEADHACFLYLFEGRIGDGHDGEFLPGCKDDVVEFVAALGVEVLDVGFDGGGGEVAGVAGDATFGGWIGLEELLDGGVDAGLLGG